MAAVDDEYEYDVCLSFAGEQRPYVHQVAQALRRQRIRVFYDEYFRHLLWGHDLYEHLDFVYRRASRYCVIFASKEYAESVWTNHERRSAQARALRGSADYLLPVRFDDTEIPGLGPNIAYVDLADVSPEQLARMIVEKSTSAAGKPRSAWLPARYIHGVALPKNWADRTAEIQRIAGLLERDDVRLLNIVAIGGTGKTSVLRKVADFFTEKAEKFDSLIWFSFYRDEDVERFFLEACRYLVPDFDPAICESTFERTALLQEAIESRSALLVLDGLERLIRPIPGSPAVGRISRREMASFFSYVLASRARTTVAVTSRVRLDEFAGAAGYFEEDLPDLQLGAAVGFFRSGGISGPERTLRLAATAYGCHALALTVYLDYVRHQGLGGDIRKVDAPLTFPAESTLADRLNRLLTHYYGHLGTHERAIQLDLRQPARPGDE